MATIDFPNIVISALRGGSGKTFVSVGIIAAWSMQGKNVSPFKKGPDYIDAGWLALAAGQPCHNLDTFLISPNIILQSLFLHAKDSDIAFIEGNRGLYDGIDMEGTTSTAELAKLIDAPVILCIDCTKSTRTMAAAVLGCLRFDSDVRIKGVILNKVAGARHEAILRNSIEHHCGVPVVGALPKLSRQNFPERHMGLIPTAEHKLAKNSVESAAKIAEQYLDLKAIYELGMRHEALIIQHEELNIQNEMPDTRCQMPNSPRIGIIRDSAFQFYYPENIEALRIAGAEVVFLSPLTQRTIPQLDGLYIGGGFPETHAKELTENVSFRQELKRLADKGLPIYAECGGLMYLGEELILDGITYPMAGVLPIVFGLCARPQGHGYTVVEVERENPYFVLGTQIRGHEFHYSNVLIWRGADSDLAFSVKRGIGIVNRKDGVIYKNVLATYTHIHALGTPSWAPSVVANARAFQNQSQKY